MAPHWAKGTLQGAPSWVGTQAIWGGPNLTQSLPGSERAEAEEDRDGGGAGAEGTVAPGAWKGQEAEPRGSWEDAASGH